MVAKDYFQDITPPSSTDVSRTPKVQGASIDAPVAGPGIEGERSIRNIQVPVRKRSAPEPRENTVQPQRSTNSYLLWGGAVLALIILGAIALVALRPTRVTVVPRSHMVIFDQTARFTAYPAASAPAGTLSFAIETSTYEETQVVASDAVERVEERASGDLTIYNEYSNSPQRLLKNTRFESPDGLIFRAPAEIVVPGKKGNSPGQITVTVIADRAGESYNTGPVARFTLPGLKSSPMYSRIYARSSAAMSGGFAGDRPKVTPSVLAAARAEIRGRLEEKAREAVSARGAETFAFYELAKIIYETLPPFSEGEGQVRIGERLSMELPIFLADSFAQSVAEGVSASSDEGSVILKPVDLSAMPAATSTLGANGNLSFTLGGRAQIVWKIDVAELASALAGRDNGAFQTIIEGFEGIDEARARIEPFWKKSFPDDPDDIRIVVKEPAADNGD